MRTEPLRPTILETVLYESDEGAEIAVLPGVLWLAPGDIVELDNPSRDARVLSTRLQLRQNEARVLIVLDVPDDAVDALRGEMPMEVALGADTGQTLTAADGLDIELEGLTNEVQLEPAPDQA